MSTGDTIYYLCLQGFDVEVQLCTEFKNNLQFKGTLIKRTPDLLVLSQKGKPVNIPRNLVTHVKFPSKGTPRNWLREAVK